MLNLVTQTLIMRLYQLMCNINQTSVHIIITNNEMMTKDIVMHRHNNNDVLQTHIELLILNKKQKCYQFATVFFNS